MRRVGTALVLSGGDTTLAMQVLFGLAAAGRRSILLSSRPDDAAAYSRHHRRFIQAPADLFTGPPERAIAFVNGVIGATSVDAVIAADTAAARFLAAARGGIAVAVFPVPGPEQFALANDKWRFAELCRAIGVAAPRSVLVPDKAALADPALAEDIGFPLVVKPTTAMFCQGLAVAANRAELHRKVVANPDYEWAPLIVQDFVDGEDIDISVLAAGGRILCHAVQRRTAEGYEFLAAPELVAATRKIIAHLGYQGVAHFDARRERETGRILFLECNPRFWGSLCHAQFCGLNFVGEGLQLMADPAAYRPRALAAGRSMPAGRLLAGLARAPVATLPAIAPFLRRQLAMRTDPLPGLVTRWREWRAQHPRATGAGASRLAGKVPT